MKSKTVLKGLASKVKHLRKLDKKLAKTYVSLFLVVLLIAASCFAWFTTRDVSKMNAELLEFQSASSLRINKDKFSAKEIKIDQVTLDEASSVDGRNIYFPVGETFNENTAEMFFREGNVGDENVHYVYKTFDLKGTSGNTPVYIKSYKITVTNADGTIDNNDGVTGIYQDELKVENDSNGVPDHQVLPPSDCPIRLAFIADSGVKPVVIDPSAQVSNYVDNSSEAVYLVDDDGVPTTKDTYADNFNWQAFSTYYYEHTPLFIIPGGKTLNVSLVVWLEGTLPRCKDYIGKKISVDIDIESNFAEQDTIKFVDGTVGDTDNNSHYWVSNDNPIIACSYEDPFSEESHKRWKTIIMRKTREKDANGGAEWECEIPKKAKTNISFYRLTTTNGSSQGTIYNAWHTRVGVDSMTKSSISDWKVNGPLQETREFFDTSTNTYDNALVYTAIHGHGYSNTTVMKKRLSPCIGYWNFTAGSGSASTGGGGQQTGGGTATECALTVIVSIPDGKSWVSSGDALGFETDAGNYYLFNMSAWTDNNKANQTTVNLPAGTKIVKFIKRNGAGVNLDSFSGGTQTYTVPNQGSCTVTYQLDNNDHWGHN